MHTTNPYESKSEVHLGNLDLFGSRKFWSDGSGIIKENHSFMSIGQGITCFQIMAPVLIGRCLASPEMFVGGSWGSVENIRIPYTDHHLNGTDSG